jgi:hypothetical protein
MRVKVIGQLRDDLWYNIGETYNVEPYCRNDKYTDGSIYYQIPGWNGLFEGHGSNLGEKYWLFVKDCEIIPDISIKLDDELFGEL